MRNLWIVFKNELMRYFISPLAYIYLMSFLLLNGVATFYFGHLFERGQASLFYMFYFLPWLYLLFLPGISMRLWAEEFKSKSIVQIMTMPVTLPTLVWGKFLASLVFCLLALLLTFPFVITVYVLGQPDGGVIFLSYLAGATLAGAMLAISQTMSALTKNQVIALVLAVIANLVFFFSGFEFVLSFFRLFLPDYMIDTIASFSFLTHFNSLINGLLEWRDVLFFASIIILFNFMTMLIVSFKTAGSSFWLKSTNKWVYACAIFLMLIGFMGFNLLANNLTRGTQFDFTQEKTWTLNKDSVHVLENLPENVTAKLYFSNILSKRNPDLRQMFDRVKMLLENYKTASNGKFNYRIYHPQNLDDSEDKAISDGLQAIPLIDINQNALFGLSITDSLDNKEVIPYLSPERLSFLEQDLTSLIYRLSHKKKTVGVISSLPILGGASENDSIMLQPFEISKKIGELYHLKLIQKPEDFDERPDLLLIIHPKSLSDEMVQKIRQYSQDFGKILLLLDGAAEAQRLYMNTANPYGASELGGLDNFWGFKFYSDYVVADLKNSITVDATSNYKTNPAYTQDVIQFKLSENNFNPFSSITKNLKSLMMTSASVIMPLENAEINFMPLLMASDDSALMPISVVYNGLNPRQILSFYQKDENVKFLAAYIHGRNPKNQFDLIVAGDTDFIYDSFWGSKQNFLEESYFVPLFNNADFILNALDFLANDKTLLDLRGKGAKNRPFNSLENLRKQSIFEYKVKEEEIFQRIEETKLKLQEVWNKRDFEERETFTPDELSLISNIKKELNTLRLNLSDVRSLSTSKIEKIALKTKLVNIFAVPLILSLCLIIIILLRRPRVQKTKSEKHLNKELGKIAALCLLLLVCGLLTSFMNNLSEIEQYEGKPIFPKLANEINQIKEIKISTHDKALTFVLKDGLWGLKERPEIPVYQERIRSFLSALIEGTLYEKKSDRAENLSAFGLTPTEIEGSVATRIELFADNGALIEGMDVGKYDIELGRGGSAAYIKFDGKFQVWKAEIELVDLSLDPDLWTYSHLWDLRFGRLFKINGQEDEALIAEYMKHFLNSTFKSTAQNLHQKKKIAGFMLDVENGVTAKIDIYQEDQKYFAKYKFEGENVNKHIELFDKSAQMYYFEIDAEDWEKIKNVNNLAKGKNRTL